MFCPDTPYEDYLKLAYFPDRLAGPAHKVTRAEHLIQARKLNRHFQEWLKEKGESPRKVALKDLSNRMLKFCMAIEVTPKAEGGRGNTSGTANKLFRHVKAVWEMAARSEEDDDGPVLIPRICRTKPYRETKREPRAWFPEDTAAITLAAMTTPGIVGDMAHPVEMRVVKRCTKKRPYGEVLAFDFWPALLLTKLSMGNRISSHMAIPTGNWDHKRAQVLIPGDEQKQRADQVFDLLPSAQDALLRLAPHERGLPTLFADWPHDAGEGWRALRKHHRVLLVRAGLFQSVREISRRDHFHKYRKTVGTEIAIKLGIDAAREYLGHSSTQVTLAYIDKRRMVRTEISKVMDDPMKLVRARAQLKLFSESA